MINKLFSNPIKKSLPQDSSSILMSDELKDNIENLNLDSDALELVKKRTKLVVIKTTINDKKDVILGTLKGIGYNKLGKISIELNVEQEQALLRVNDFLQNRLKLFGIEIHINDTVIDLLQEVEIPYNLIKCNIYDVVIETDDCTMVLLISLKREVV